jgi:molecular chaperone GrpE
MSEESQEQSGNEDWFVIDEGDVPEMPPEFMKSAEPPGAPEEPGNTAAPKAGVGGPPTTAEEELEQLRERLIRVSADYENFKKRSYGNIQTSLEQQLMSVVRDLLPVLDHFDRAVEVDPEATTTEDLLSGVNLVRDELLRMLNRYGIERIDVEQGEPFDPNRHQAMMRQPAEDVESDHVAEQLQPGYALKNMTIRPAGVTVAE